MAEQKKPVADFDPVEVILGAVILFFIVSFLFQSLSQKIQSPKPGGIAWDAQTLLQKIKNGILGKPTNILGRPLALSLPVKNSHPTILYDGPGGKALRGMASGLSGTIIDGPVEAGGNTWWKVQYEDGSVGWVLADSLVDAAVPDEIVSNPPEGPISTFYMTLWGVSVWVSLLLLAGITYSAIRLFQIRKEEAEKLRGDGVFFGKVPGAAPQNLPTAEHHGRAKWEVIQKHLHSESETDWRLSVLEADILLDELVRSKGFPGENLGERLKQIDRSDFRTIDQAWEAHKIRNTIAHEGINFPLSRREAERVIGLYAQVFQEFDYL